MHIRRVAGIGYLFVLFVVGVGSPLRSEAGDGRLNWYTIESEHFVITYHEPLADVAKRVVQVAEYAHQVLVPVMAHVPDSKTYIVIDDTSDSTNGFAQVVPRNKIVLLVSAPPSKSNLADHDDWLYSLVLHEYAHILHLDTIGGPSRWINQILGKTHAPNQNQPRWIVEGLATYEESRHSSGGRLRSSLVHSMMRMASLSNDERELDEMSNGPRRWPQGDTVYVYGSHFLDYIFDRFGEEKLAQMSHWYGAAPIPYGINRAINRVTGKNFVQLHGDWKKYRRERYGMEEEGVARRGRAEGRRLTFSGLVNFNPQYTRDGKSIVWLSSPGTRRGEFSIMPASGHSGQQQHFATIERAGEYDLLSDGSMVVEITDIDRAFYASQELFLYDPKNDSTQRLTRRVRARDPKISPDERQVAFVVTAQGQRSLAVMDLRPGAEVRILWQGGDAFDQAFDPSWSPDGSQIAFSAWRQGGFRDIIILDVATGAAHELSHDRAQDVDPVFDPLGRYLYYSSDRTGIFNVFAYELASGDRFQVTNVLGYAVTPGVSPDGTRMVYRGYVSDGTELYEMALDRAAWKKADLYVDDRPEPVSVADNTYVSSEPRPYSPLETLAPRNYNLQYNAGAHELAVRVRGEDVVGHHSWNLSSTIDFSRRDIATLAGSYRYVRNWASLRFSGFRSVVPRGGLVVDDRNQVFREERIGATLSVGLPVIRGPVRTGTLSLAYDVDSLRDVDTQNFEPDPNTTVTQRPETDVHLAGVALRFSYSDTRGAIYALGPVVGRSLNLSIRLERPGVGSDFTGVRFDYQLRTHHKLPWGQTPALFLRLGGGIRTSNRSQESRFRLGGVVQQDVARSVLNNLRTGSTGYLRGYGANSAVGTQMHLANLEYRQELFDIEKGLATLPFYLQKLHFAMLADVGNAFDSDFSPLELKTALGVSMRLNMVIGYFSSGALDIGYARGLDEGAIHEWWALLTGTI